MLGREAIVGTLFAGPSTTSALSIAAWLSNGEVWIGWWCGD